MTPKRRRRSRAASATEIKLDIQQSTPAPPAGYDAASVADAQSWFTKLQAYPALVSWVNGPLS